MKVTVSVIKADVGSIGGHTRPSKKMLERVEGMVAQAKKSLLIDGLVTHTGDDIALIMSHTHGEGSSEVHQFAWNCFLAGTEVAQQQGLYGAGQDLLVDAPSGNVRGAGPGVAEIEFDLDPKSKERPAEAFLVFAADKCGPGAYNFPLYSTFCDPISNSGLILSPKLHAGFVVEIIDMDHSDSDRLIELNVPEQAWEVATLLQNPDRFAIESIRSRYVPDETIVSVSATRMHNIAGKYTGKDDPVALVRVQALFPAPEEVVMPYTLGHFVNGGARGSHIMPIMPVPINEAVVGPYCLPLVSCLAFSMDKDGNFSGDYTDMFGNRVWDSTRLKIQAKADEWRRQGFVGPTMASHAELAYTGIVDTMKKLESRFKDR
jgi:fructose 1,6-bisphosphate aldolase/phosphatase